MLIANSKLVAVLKKVDFISDHIRKHATGEPGPKLNIEDLHWALEDAYSLKIQMLEVVFEGSHIVGKAELYADKRARVLVKAGQSLPDQRFAATKELSHLMIDEEDDWSANIEQTIDDLLLEWKLEAENGIGHENPSNALQSEYLAEIAAIELLYPYVYRDGDLARLRAGETSLERIAQEHGMPSHAVQQAHRHHETLTRCRQMLADG